MNTNFTELSMVEMESIDGGDININFDVNKAIDQVAHYGRSWWNFWEEKGGEVYDVFQ
ncbi:hypothetical protein [Ruminococcus sp. XPD3002]|uniref:hypothetical protein n=1 Tax=Ruminococcus sp. XPD3002 TaxID=1452269 RepID=UPI0009215F8F|nr:hypothetical protein SAMN04487832_12922 [Ruminococcus flavefaciens]